MCRIRSYKQQCFCGREARYPVLYITTATHPSPSISFKPSGRGEDGRDVHVGES